MLSGRIRMRTGQVVIESAGRPENPVEAGMAIATVHSARSDAFSVLWLEPAYGLVYVLRGSVDIAVLDRTGAVLEVFPQVEDSASTPGHVSKRALAKSPIAVIGRSGTLGERLVPGMVLFWQDRPLVPLARPTPGQDPAPDEVPDWAPALGWDPDRP